MPGRTFRVLGAPPALGAPEQAEVEEELRRVRALLASLPGPALVRMRDNPAGTLGEYAALLLDATARGLPPEIVLPAAVRRRYGGQRWFAVSLEVLDAFTAQFEARQSAATGGSLRSLPGAPRDWLRRADGHSRSSREP